MADFDWGSVVGPALGAIGSIYAGKQNAKAAQQAQQTQQAAAAPAIQAQQPYMDLGARAAALLGNEDITKLPGYQTGLDAGLGAIDRRAAAAGGFNSGNRLKAAARYATDYNASKTGERQNQLMQLLGAGQNATNNFGNLQTSLGNSAAASGISQSGSKLAGLTGALDLASKYLTSKDSSGNSGWTNLSNGISSAYNAWKPAASNDTFNQNFGDWGFD